MLVAAIAAGGSLAAASPAQAWTVSPPALRPLAAPAGALPAMGVPLTELLHAVPQLAPGAPGGGRPSLGHGATATAPVAEAGSIIEVRTGMTVQVRRFPGGPVAETLDWRSDSMAEPRAFTVYAVAGGQWLGVSVPSLDGHLGWIAADPARLSVRAALEEIHVSLAQRRLELLHAGRIVFSTPVVIGSATTPTPPGQFSVDDIRHFAPASPEYGVGALALSVPPPGRNWVYWRVAIHGMNNLGQLGGSGSLGCVHVPTADLRRLLEVPVGTPVDIVA